MFAHWSAWRVRLLGLSDWISSVEKLMKEMGQENISSDEYKDMLAKFQVCSCYFFGHFAAWDNAAVTQPCYRRTYGCIIPVRQLTFFSRSVGV
jgi:hypothetical protein